MGSFAARTKALFTRKETAAATPSINEDPEEPAQVVIVGAGIVGLVLALALHKHCGIKVELYEQAQAFHDDVGAGMGMYPNGLRVIRDISPELLEQIKEQGYPYIYRRWGRHDGTEVAVAEEKVLADGDEELQTVGIRRWRLQKVLFEAVLAAGMKIHFNKRLEGIKQVDDDITLRFCDGSHRITKLLLAVDGSKSLVRNIVSKRQCHLKYSGVTCLMGISTVASDTRGICLPSSETSKCHGAFYPTGPTEQCFQFHFPVPKEEAQASMGAWGTLTEVICQEECEKLASRLKEEGWDEKFVTPLYHVDKAVKFAFSTLEPHLDTFVYGRIVLVGDAAHPPVPYLGQGAQQGLEDAGTLALLLKQVCTVEVDDAAKNNNGATTLSLTHLDTALKLYNQLRVPRTTETFERGKTWGAMQQKRAENTKYNVVKEEKIKREVFFHETLSVLFNGAKYDYKDEVLQALKEERLLPVPEEDIICW